MDSVKESDETIVLTVARIFIEQASETFLVQKYIFKLFTITIYYI
jgi:hypothetical protein